MRRHASHSAKRTGRRWNHLGGRLATDAGECLGSANERVAGNDPEIDGKVSHVAFHVHLLSGFG
jgi:hypothetical protein